VDLSQVRAVLFDAVGTLIYPQPSVAEVYAAAGAKHGSRYTVQDIRKRFPFVIGRIAERMPAECSDELERWRWQMIVADIFDDVPNASGPLFAQLWEHFAQGKHWALFEDVTPLWEALEERGVTIGIASNFDGRLVSVCAHHHLLRSCRHLFYSSAVGHSKPSQEFFNHIAVSLGRPAVELLLIGDDARYDLAGAQAAGWQALLINRKASIDEAHVMHDLRELISRLPAQV
jgi:putative hydrolase of the HAD superfamily